jgi:hypothetical protein
MKKSNNNIFDEALASLLGLLRHQPNNSPQETKQKNNIFFEISTAIGNLFNCGQNRKDEENNYKRAKSTILQDSKIISIVSITDDQVGLITL